MTLMKPTLTDIPEGSPESIMPKLGFGRVKSNLREVYWTDAFTVSHGRLFIAIGRMNHKQRMFMRWWMRRHGKYASGMIVLNRLGNPISVY